VKIDQKITGKILKEALNKVKKKETAITATFSHQWSSGQNDHRIRNPRGQITSFWIFDKI